MLKKFTSIIVVAALAVSIAACGGTNQENSTTSATTSAATSENASSSTVSTNTAKTWASTSEQFDPLKDQTATTFEEMRKKLGPIPKSTKSFALAGNVKAFTNVVWREISNGYVGFSKTVQTAGGQLTVDTSSPQGENDEEGQLTILKDQIRKGVNAILLSPISDANCIPGVEAAHQANIPVFSINNEFNGADMFVGPNSLNQGELAAKWVNDKLGGSGNVAIVMGMPKTGVTRNRTAGFAQWFGANGSKIKVVEQQNADWDRSKAKDLATTWLKVHPDLKAIFCNNDVMALGVVEAVKQAGLTLNKDIFVVGCDGTEEAYDSIKKNEMAATISSFPYYEGYMGAEVAYRMLVGQDVPRVVFTPCKMIDSTNISKSNEEILGWQDPSFK
jgi:ribose transport system substrate-binding protein